MKKQNLIIVGALAFVLALAVGYAMFSDQLTVTGSATASGNLNVEFTTVGSITQVGSAGATATINASSSKKIIDVAIPKLQYPGAYVSFPATIKNTGTIDAKITSITETGLVNGPLKVTYTGVAKDTVLLPNATATLTVKVEWLASNNTTVSAANFSIVVNYQQAQ